MEEVLKVGDPHRNHQNNERFHILYRLLDDDDDDDDDDDIYIHVIIYCTYRYVHMYVYITN